MATGDTITITVVASESSPNTELSTEGLVGFGLAGTYGATSGVSAQVTGVTINPVFNTPRTNGDTFTDSTVNLAASRVAVGGFPIASTIQLGEFTVSVSDLGVTQFSLDDFSAFNDFVTTDATPLDNIFFASNRTFDFTITGVPEPGLIWVGTVATVAIGWRRRKSNR